MADPARQQRDLFESPPTSTTIPIDTHQQVLALLKELLTEALGSHPVEIGDDVDKEGGDDQNHA